MRLRAESAKSFTIKLNPIQVVFSFNSPRSPSHDNSNLTRATCLPALEHALSAPMLPDPPPPSPFLFFLLRHTNGTTTTLERVRTDFSSFQSDMTAVLHRGGEDWRGEGREGGGVGSCRVLSVSANSSALSNSMHVLMKHCWPAAHCQRHCCIDDWSIEGPRAFVRKRSPAFPPPIPDPLA